MLKDKVKPAIEKVFNAGFQIDVDAYQLLSSINEEELNILVDRILKKIKKMTPKPLTINKDMIILQKNEEKDSKEYKLPISKKRSLADEYDKKIEILFDPTNIIGSEGKIEDFHKYFTNRFEKISKILKERIDVRDARPLTEAIKSSKNSPIKSIVMVTEKIEKTKYIILRVEDLERDASVLVSRKNNILYSKAQIISKDQVICIEFINYRNNLLIARDIVFPGIPEKEITKTDNPLSALLISDLHLGSQMFLHGEFRQLVNWLKGKIGNSKQKSKASMIKYIIITGDLVDGVGIYPNQEKELAITNIYKQYTEMAKYFSDMPDDIDIIVIPGNHDAVRQALPQPAINRDFAEPIYELENITVLGNPSWIKLNDRVFLLYHGTSINDIVSLVPSLSLENPEKALRYSIDARHMAISFGSSTPIAPEREDMMVIEKVPDVMQSGHIHIAGYENYKGTLLISCAAWQAQTEYQRKMGVVPTIGEAAILNLGKMEIGVMDFKENEKIKMENIV